MNNIKVLIISHNPITTYQNMGKTMLSLFSSFKKEELCQLYIYPSVPNVDKCASYYRVTDKNVLESFYKFKVKGGEVAPDSSIFKKFESEKDKKAYENPKNNGVVRRIARDVIWGLSHWYNKSLKEWLDIQAPTHIFVAPGTAKCVYNMALRISKRYNISIITYVCDEYYFVKKDKGFLARLRQKSFHKKIEELMYNSTRLVTICKSLEDSYTKKFKTPATTVMTGSNYDIEREIKEYDKVTTLRYMGNISCKRFTSLAEIGRTLDEINAEDGTNYSLEIFTGEKNSEILATFDGIKSIKLCGYVGGEDFDRTFKASQMLLHTEAFDEDSIDLVKNSVSTKIADSLGSGIAFFAYGPSQVASMKHLIDNDCAMIATSKDELKDVLRRAFTDKDFRSQKAKNGLAVALECHDRHVAGDKILEVFRNIKTEK